MDTTMHNKNETVNL